MRAELLVEARAEFREILPANIAMTDRLGMIVEALPKARAILRCAQGCGFGFRSPKPVNQRFGFGEQRVHRPRTAFLHDIVGVLTRGQGRKGQRF